MPEGWSRREVLSTLATGVAAAGLSAGARSAGPASQEKTVSALRIRTITAGVELKNASDGAALERALARATRARNRAQDAGFEAHLVKPVDFAVLDSLLNQLPPAGARRS